MKVSQKKRVVGDTLFIWRRENKGVAFNRFEKFPRGVTVFTGAAIFALFLYFMDFVRQGAGRLFKISFACLMGGALGNFIDRCLHQSVTDFIYIKKGSAPIFNAADVFVALGSFLCVISCLFCKTK